MRFLGAGGKMGFGPGRSTYATGGDYVYLYEEGGKTYRVHEFHTTGTSTLNVEVGGQMEYLVVGGGGGGGRGCGGGGGGGGALYGNTNVSVENITISVGAGGTGAIYNPTTASIKGMDSSFNGIVAYGGGNGGGGGSEGGTGGAGGGGYGVRNATPGSGAPGITGQGYAGGDGSNSASTTTRAGGGGGGSGETGQDASVGVGGNGGSGIEWPTGSGNYYGGGGGGYVEIGTPGSGGTGGGGAGANSTNDGGNGLTSTGGGGGGGGASYLSNGGNGGSGIVIVRYPLNIVEYYDIEAGQNLGTPTATQSSAGTWTLGEISNQNLVLAFDAIFPSTPAQGCLAEKGGSSFGFWCGLKSSGTYFRVRAGGGGSAPATNIALLDIYDFPADDELHTVVVEIEIDGGMTMRVWIDGILKGTDTSTATSAAGSGSGVFLSGGANVNVTGEPSAAWPGGTAEGEARFYSNTLISS